MAEAARSLQFDITVVDRATRDVQKIVRDVERQAEKATAASKIAITAEDQATAELLRIQKIGEKVHAVFTQPLRVTIADFATSQIEKIGAALVALKAKGIIPVSLGVGGAAVGLGAGALAAGAVGLGIAKSVDDAADLGAAMIRVNKLIGFDEGAKGGKAAIKGLEDDIQRMMINMGMPLEEVVQAYERAGAAGIGGEFAKTGNFEAARDEIEGYVQISLQAASAFKMPAEATTQYLGIIANNYKPAGVAVNEYLKHVASGIDAVADATLASEEDLLVYMSGITSITAQMTKSAEVDKFFMTMGATLKGTGLSANEAATATERLFKNAKLHSEDLSKMLGMGQEEFLVKLKESPQDIFQELVNYYKSLPITQQAEFTKLFGLEGGPIFEKAAGEKWGEIWGTAEEALGPAYDAGERISESFEKSMGGLWPQVRKLSAAFTVLRQAVGAGPATALTGILTIVNALVIPLVLVADKLMELGAKIPGGKYIAGAIGLGMIATAIQFMIPLLSGLAVKFGLATAAQGVFVMWTNIAKLAIGGFGKALMFIMNPMKILPALIGGVSKAMMLLAANPVGAVITVIVLLVAAVGALLYKTGYLQKAWDKFVNSPVGEDLKAFLELVKGGIGQAWGAINAKWEIVSPETKEIMGHIADLLGGAFLFYVDYMIKCLEIIIAIIKKIWGFGEILWGWLSKIVKFLTELPGAIKASLPESLVGRDALAGEKLAEAFGDAMQKEHPGSTPDQVAWLTAYGRKYGLGDESAANQAALANRPEGITQPMIKDAVRIMAELGRGTPGVFGPAPTSGTVTNPLGAPAGADTWEYDPATGQPIYTDLDTGESWTTRNPVNRNTGFLETLAGTVSNIFHGSRFESTESTEPLAAAGGTDYIPRTGWAILHKGEAVVPASQNRGSSTINMPITFNNVTVSSESDKRWLESMVRRVATETIKTAVAQRRT